jgi:hypothetical protein
MSRGIHLARRVIVEKQQRGKMPAIDGIVIHERSVFSLDAAGRALGLGKHSLPTEVRKGRLKASRRCGRYMVLGKWLIEWIEQGIKKRAKCHVASRVEPAHGILRGEAA